MVDDNVGQFALSENDLEFPPAFHSPLAANG